MKKSVKFDVEKTFPLGKPKDCIDVKVENNVNKKKSDGSPYTIPYFIADIFCIVCIIGIATDNISVEISSLVILYVCLRIGDIILWNRKKKKTQNQ
jgi:hypothetical protein